ncbi:O-antigen ligase family protein [Lachnospiraceae bacterium 62-35]
MESIRRNHYSKTQKILCVLFIIYPFFDIFFTYITKNDGVLTMHVCFCAILIGLIVGEKCFYNKIVPHISYFVFVMIWIFCIGIDIIKADDLEGISYGLKALSLMILLHYFWKNDFYNVFSRELERHVWLWTLVNIGVFVVVLLSVSQGGIYSHWGTTSLTGPYLLNHTLAYLMLFIVCGDLYLWIKKTKGIMLLCAGISLIIMLLTGVRTIIIPITYLGWIYAKRKGVRGFLYTLFLGICGIVLLYRTGVLNTLIEKTVYAALNGSVSNGRFNIWKSSFNAYLTSGDIWNYLTGICVNGLKSYNNLHIGFNIHAHNDIVTIFVAFGPLAVVVFMYTFFKYLRDYATVFFLFPLLFFNGFITYGQAVILFVFGVVLIQYGMEGIRAVRCKDRDGSKTSVKIANTIKGRP